LLHHFVFLLSLKAKNRGAPGLVNDSSYLEVITRHAPRELALYCLRESASESTSGRGKKAISQSDYTLWCRCYVERYNNSVIWHGNSTTATLHLRVRPNHCR